MRSPEGDVQAQSWLRVLPRIQQDLTSQPFEISAAGPPMRSTLETRGVKAAWSLLETSDVNSKTAAA